MRDFDVVYPGPRPPKHALRISPATSLAFASATWVDVTTEAKTSEPGHPRSPSPARSGPTVSGPFSEKGLLPDGCNRQPDPEPHTT
jgi:hypothetical protein